VARRYLAAIEIGARSLHLAPRQHWKARQSGPIGKIGGTKARTVQTLGELLRMPRTMFCDKDELLELAACDLFRARPLRAVEFRHHRRERGAGAFLQ
jgi:hypothetical protein